MDSLRDRALREGTPLIDGDRVTFVWLGEGEVPSLLGDFNNWDRQEPLALETIEPGVHAAVVTLPSDAYVEYCYVRIPDIEERYPDPHNPRLVYNGVGAFNHAILMPDCALTDLTTRAAGVARGAISEHDLPARFLTSDSMRRVYLYHPPTDDPVPLVVVYDGQDYLFRGRLNQMIDNLIAQRRIRPVALAFVSSPHSPDNRYSEYMHNDATVFYLLHTLLPFATQTLNLIDAAESPGVHGVLGASMGGLMAVFTGLRLPDVFGRVLTQAGAFYYNQRFGALQTDMVVGQMLHYLPTLPIRIWQDVGTLDFLHAGNVKMRDLLNKRGYDVTYHEFAGGHNYQMWLNSVWRGLETLFPPL